MATLGKRGEVLKVSQYPRSDSLMQLRPIKRVPLRSEYRSSSHSGTIRTGDTPYETTATPENRTEIRWRNSPDSSAWRTSRSGWHTANRPVRRSPRTSPWMTSCRRRTGHRRATTGPRDDAPKLGANWEQDWPCGSKKFTMRKPRGKPHIRLLFLNLQREFYIESMPPQA